MNYSDLWLVKTTNVRPSATFTVTGKDHDQALRNALDATPDNFSMERLTVGESRALITCALCGWTTLDAESMRPFAASKTAKCCVKTDVCAIREDAQASR